MDLVLIVSIDGLEKEEIVKTKIGRVSQDISPVLLNESVRWYAESSSGEHNFRKINQVSTIGQEINQNIRWVKEEWVRNTYGIKYHVVTEDEARKLIETKPYNEQD